MRPHYWRSRLESWAVKRALLLVSSAALVVLAACSSGPSSARVNGQLSAHTRSASDPAANAAARKGGSNASSATTDATFQADARRHHHRTTTTLGSTTTAPSTPTTPTTPSTMAQSGVAGAAVTQTCNTPGQPCQLQGGQQAALKLLDSKGNVVASGHTSDGGGFVIPVKPGTYKLTATPPSRTQVCDPQNVTVTEGHYTSVLVYCHAK